MPTFPSPPLKFRTAGFPRYGFKAGISDKAFPLRPANEGVYIRASDGLVARAVAGYHYSANWVICTGRTLTC